VLRYEISFSDGIEKSFFSESLTCLYTLTSNLKFFFFFIKITIHSHE
jgi:hypothetical protein